MLTENNEYRELIENIKTKVKAAQYRVMSQARWIVGQLCDYRICDTVADADENQL